MIARTTSRDRRYRLAALLTCVALTSTACGSGKVGTAVPDGDAVAKYVSAKFDDVLSALQANVAADEDKKTRMHRYIKLDERWMDSPLEAARLGNPPMRLVKNMSNRDPDARIDVLHPPDSEYDYQLLGPTYRSLAKTRWVAVPTSISGWECTWGGIQEVCKIADAIQASMKANRRALRSAASKPDGSVEIDVDVTYNAFLDARVIVLPQDAQDTIRENFGDQVIATRIVIDAERQIKELAMNGKQSGGGHELEVRMTYTVLGKPTKSEFPSMPDKKEITVLKDRKGVDDFYARKAKLEGR